MDLYQSLLKAVNDEFINIKQLKSGLRGQVSVLRHKSSGKRFVFREYQGDGTVYKKLLTVSCVHLPEVLEVAEQDGKVAVLEEYVQGDTLDFLLEAGLFTVKQTKEIARQLCSALWVLHSMGAVHRDIKPENVILRGDQAVLIDFDASRIVKDGSEMDTVVLGTVGFAAPEQYGLSQSDGRADIYAMGVLLNIMLTGKHPSAELAPGKMGKIIQRCTMMNLQKRFQTVSDLMEAF